MIKPLWLGATYMILLMSATRGSAEQVMQASTHSEALQITLSTDRLAYRVGDDPRVRVQVHNVSNNPIGTSNAGLAPTSVRLIITDAQGGALRVDAGLVDHPVRSNGQPYVLPAGQTLTEAAPGESSAFIPISFWRYRITQPSTYTIVAKYRPSGGLSNKVTIAVGN